MGYELTGKLISISDKQIFDSGSGKITFRIDTEEQWNNIYEFELFKKAEYIDFLDKFSEFNKIGDSIKVEFNIKTNLYKEKVYTSLSCWKTEKASNKLENPYPQDDNTPDVGDPEILPF